MNYIHAYKHVIKFQNKRFHDKMKTCMLWSSGKPRQGVCSLLPGEPKAEKKKFYSPNKTVNASAAMHCTF